MIPKFPNFKKLELKDKDDISEFTHLYPLSSDYNFVSLWSYNTQEAVMISMLENNLIIRFQDYITNDYFYSFLGKNNLAKTINTLFEYITSLGLPPILRLVAGIDIDNIKQLDKQFSITEDRDNFDYILSIDELKNLQGGKYSTHRKLINRLLKQYSEIEIHFLDTNNSKTDQEIFSLFHQWAKDKNKNDEEIKNELLAIKRVLQDALYLNIYVLGIYHKDKLIGFSISDGNHPKYIQSHFLKVDCSYAGVKQLLHHHIAKEMHKKGYNFINIEQDLGLPNLRIAKEHSKPIHFLKKFTIIKKLK